MDFYDKFEVFDKFCDKCEHRWRGNQEDWKCPNCGEEQEVCNIVYKLIDWNSEQDQYHSDVELADKHARALVDMGCTRIALQELYDYPDGDIGDGEFLDHYGAEYRSWEEVEE